jgi:hypothetical protein
MCMVVAVLSQFYAECGHALATIDDELESRLHGLYQMCSLAGAHAGGGH